VSFSQQRCFAASRPSDVCGDEYAARLTAGPARDGIRASFASPGCETYGLSGRSAALIAAVVLDGETAGDDSIFAVDGRNAT
jgi:hypothetical protein